MDKIKVYESSVIMEDYIDKIDDALELTNLTIKAAGNGIIQKVIPDDCMPSIQENIKLLDSYTDNLRTKILEIKSTVDRDDEIQKDIDFCFKYVSAMKFFIDITKYFTLLYVERRYEDTLDYVIKRQIRKYLSEYAKSAYDIVWHIKNIKFSDYCYIERGLISYDQSKAKRKHKNEFRNPFLYDKTNKELYGEWDDNDE